jgi:hypothetical protein
VPLLVRRGMKSDTHPEKTEPNPNIHYERVTTLPRRRLFFCTVLFSWVAGQSDYRLTDEKLSRVRVVVGVSLCKHNTDSI